jgi:hypothetical protein
MVGAYVGGHFVLRGSREEWARQREHEKREKSLDAAMALNEELQRFEAALIGLQHEQITQSELIDVFNAFARMASTRGLFVNDKQVTRRVVTHVKLGEHTCQLLLAHKREAQLAIRLTRRHTTAVFDALSAHVTGEPPAPYDQAAYMDASTLPPVESAF